MRAIRLLSTVAVILLVATHPAPTVGADKAWSADYAFKVKRVGTVRVSPDGSRVAFVVGTAAMEGEKSEWVSQIHLAGSDGKGEYQLTRGEKSATAPDWSPDGKSIVFVSARGDKDAKPSLWRIRLDGGEAERLTDEKGGIQSPRFSPDGSRIAFLRTDARSDAEEKNDKEKNDARVVDQDFKRIRLCVIPTEKDAEGRRPVRILTTGDVSVGNMEGAGRFDWSPDGRTIVFDHQPTPLVDDWTRGGVSIVDVETGTVRELVGGRAAAADPSFSPDGRSVALTISDTPPTWAATARVVIVPVSSGGQRQELARTYDEQPDLVGWAADGRRVLVRETHRTVNRLWALPIDGKPAVELTGPDLMVEQPSLNGKGTRLGFVSQSADRAPEAFVSDVDRFAPVQVSHAQDLPAVELGRTEVVTWNAPDGKSIEGLLTYPVGYTAGARVPLLVVVHGGPTGVFVRSFTGGPSPYPVAGFASHGYAVLRCNVRGSSGYGREFRYANYKDWGGGDYKDILSGVDALVAKGVADPDRLGIMGWSYGGYMTSWVITQTHRFKAASVGAGVTNLMSFTGTADIPSFIPDYFGGEFWEQGGLDRWRTHSAMFNVKGVTTPTLIQHGEADRRVPISQGYELYNALKRQGVTTRMVVYPRQPHGIQEPKLMLDAMNRNLEWFDRWLARGGTAPTTAP